MPDKTRLVIVSGSFPAIACGISPHVKKIAERTAARSDYEVHVLTSADPAVNAALAQNYQVHAKVKKWGPGHRHYLCGKILELEPEVVHIQNPTIKYCGWRSVTMSLVVPLLKRLASNVRVVVMQHDIALGRPTWRWRYYPLLQAADAVVVSNMRDYQAVRDQGIDAAKVYRASVSSHVKLHPRGLEASHRSRQTLGIPDDVICVAFFGFVLPQRNIDTLIRAVQVLRRSGRDAHALILGGAHPRAPNYYGECQKLTRKLRLAEHVTWTGFASEAQIADGLAAADVFVSLPERGADMRNTSIISAVLAELPIVTTRNVRYYTDPDLERLGCIFVNGRDPSAVAAAIAQQVDDPPGAEILARNAAALEPEAIWRRHIETNFRAYRGEPTLNAT